MVIAVVVNDVPYELLLTTRCVYLFVLEHVRERESFACRCELECEHVQIFQLFVTV